MQTSTSGEFHRKIGHYQDRAIVEPIMVTRDGRQRVDLISADEYDRVKKLGRRSLIDTTAPRFEPTLIAKGNCFYDITAKSISHVVLDFEIFKWKDITGTEFTNRNIYASASSRFGFGEPLNHTIREPVG